MVILHLCYPLWFSHCPFLHLFLAVLHLFVLLLCLWDQFAFLFSLLSWSPKVKRHVNNSKKFWSPFWMNLFRLNLCSLGFYMIKLKVLFTHLAACLTPECWTLINSIKGKLPFPSTAADPAVNWIYSLLLKSNLQKNNLEPHNKDFLSLLSQFISFSLSLFSFHSLLLLPSHLIPLLSYFIWH